MECFNRCFSHIRILFIVWIVQPYSKTSGIFSETLHESQWMFKHSAIICVIPQTWPVCACLMPLSAYMFLISIVCVLYHKSVCACEAGVCVCVYVCSCCFRLWVLCPVALSMSASSGEPGLSLVWPHKGTAFLWGVKNFHLCIPWTKSSRTHFRGHWQHRQTLWPRFFGTHFTDSKTGMWWTGFQQLKCPWEHGR